jgi:hypothetical protein
MRSERASGREAEVARQACPQVVAVEAARDAAVEHEPPFERGGDRRLARARQARQPQGGRRLPERAEALVAREEGGVLAHGGRPRLGASAHAERSCT